MLQDKLYQITLALGSNGAVSIQSCNNLIPQSKKMVHLNLLFGSFAIAQDFYFKKSGNSACT